MFSITNAAGGEAIPRSAAHEVADYEQAVKNLVAETWCNWPNWAGFTGLREERGPFRCTVHGNIPAWAAGTLFRTGPGSWQIDDTPSGTLQFGHWFDGLAHTHRFDIISSGDTGGVAVLYSSRHQSQAYVKYIQEHGQGDVFTFAQRRDPCVGIFGKMMSSYEPAKAKDSQAKDRPTDEIKNICVALHADVPGLASATENSVENQESFGHRGMPGTVWITSDNSKMRRIDPETLEPLGTVNQTAFHPDLKGPISCTHAQRCPRTGDFFNFNLDLGSDAAYRVFRVSAATGSTEILATIASSDVKPAYIHSFFLTEHFVILCIPSTHFLEGGRKVMMERNILDAIAPFDKSQTRRWLVVDRVNGRGVVAEFESDAGFFFHSVNSFETTTESGAVDVFCDVVEYPNQDILRSLYYDVLINRNREGSKFWGDESKGRGSLIQLVRYKLHVPLFDTAASTPPAKQLKVQRAEQQLVIRSPHAGELASINPNFNTRRHRYMYSLCNRGLSTLFDGIVKTDIDTREVCFWGNPRDILLVSPFSWLVRVV
ncbi:hypothetical protein J7T55_000749 [Diaporthe amygdali]|uniref:uncharacterized protein n=1 Tax=Phomopsis amygdali TaxID=1214568 RepID=UPI0022FECFF8|nr:uncharacterized protein J7T55_000749 [Diaporthe amygdali]KAJ0119899.1 hypothetical protein J7T55_000749 [Diaporthe amygdali]